MQAHADLRQKNNCPDYYLEFSKDTNLLTAFKHCIRYLREQYNVNMQDIMEALSRNFNPKSIRVTQQDANDTVAGQYVDIVDYNAVKSKEDDDDNDDNQSGKSDRSLHNGNVPNTLNSNYLSTNTVVVNKHKKNKSVLISFSHCGDGSRTLHEPLNAFNSGKLVANKNNRKLSKQRSHLLPYKKSNHDYSFEEPNNDDCSQRIKTEDSIKNCLGKKDYMKKQPTNSFILPEEAAVTEDEIVEIISPDFDILHVTKDSEMFRKIWVMFLSSRVVSSFDINGEKYSRFIGRVKDKYDARGNHYHNFKHAIVVLNGCYFFVACTPLQTYLDELSTAAFLFSALMHDIDHTSRNNLFEINTRSKLAIRYNDYSVLENHHCASAFKILSGDDYNIFENMDVAKYPYFRKIVIACILATDVKRHFSDLAKFQDRFDSGDFSPYHNSQDDSDF